MELNDIQASNLLIKHDAGIEKTMLFSDWKPSDFHPCKIRYFDPSVDFVAIMASYDPNPSKSSTGMRKIVDISLEDESKRVKTEMDITIKEVEDSEFYSKLTHQLRNNPDFQSNIKRVLGSNQHMTMLIYALGSIESSYMSQYQLSLAMLLKQDFKWVGEIQVFDPMMSPVDCKVIEELGCKVLSVNEQCRRQVMKPTLVYMPYAEKTHRWNLLDANWCPSQINQMILLCSRSEKPRKPMGKSMYNGKVYYDAYTLYREVIRMYTAEFEIYAPREDYRNIFYAHAWNFFNVESHLDMETLLPDDFTEEMRLKERETWKTDDYIHLRNCAERTVMDTFKENEDKDDPEKWWDLYREHRIPHRLSCLWRPPHAGWVKLNFSGKGHDKTTNAGFGGIFRNQFKHRMALYSGNLGEADSIVANAEALRQGLRCLQYMSTVRKLVLEGNDLSIIRWVNHGPEPPNRIREALVEIFELLKDVEFVAYRVYEEANSAAMELANKGAKLLKLGIWIS